MELIFIFLFISHTICVDRQIVVNRFLLTFRRKRRQQQKIWKNMQTTQCVAIYTEKNEEKKVSTKMCFSRVAIFVCLARYAK